MIIESMYFPPVKVLMEMQQYGKVTIDRGEYFRKGSFRNKCLINSSHGTQLLSVPLKKGKNNLMPMCDVQISYDEDWPRQHLSSIRTCYGKSPYFIYLIDEVESVIASRPKFLVDLNEKSLFLLYKYILKGIDILYCEQYIETTGQQDFRNVFKLNNYQQADVNHYPQVFEGNNGFLPNLSGLDLLFCQGRYGYLYL
ncbi:MAG: WbqC family protein [Saprospiraceae bacterium]|nr:WbqC family protein [Saprospiraceae bacterium]